MVVSWVGVAEEFVGVVDVVDLGWSGAVGPGQPAVIGDGGGVAALGFGLVVGAAGEEQFVGVGATVGRPGWGVVDLAVIPRLGPSSEARSWHARHQNTSAFTDHHALYEAISSVWIRPIALLENC